MRLKGFGIMEIRDIHGRLLLKANAETRSRGTAEPLMDSSCPNTPGRPEPNDRRGPDAGSSPLRLDMGVTFSRSVSACN